VNLTLDDQGVPSMVMGRIGGRAYQNPEAAAQVVLEEQGAAFRRGADDSFLYRVEHNDDLGQTHVRMAQTYRGLPVIGGELIVHMTGDQVIGINGRFMADLNVDTRVAISDASAAARAMDYIKFQGGVDIAVAEIKSNVIHSGRVAIPVQVTYSHVDGDEIDDIYIDAKTGAFLGKDPLVHRAKTRKVYNGNQSCSTSSLPGTLMFSEGGSSTDTVAMGAYNNTGYTWDYYKATFNRDSYNNAGAQLTSTVHFQFSTGTSCTKNNAAWFSSLALMAYGDGDGTSFTPLANSLDVTAHELTHAVTSSTANLAYQSDSGALNEATSDILGESAAFYKNAGDWKIGAEVYTPNVAGDALRYFATPTTDGYSADYYPERLYASGCTPSSSNDQCGVHGNSGIANLFFYLVSQGGTHPRGKTTVAVPAIGIAKAQQIWYRALVSYMTSSTNFQGARTATAQAAADLYGGTCTPEWTAVQKGWDAVGVPGTWTCGGTPPSTFPESAHPYTNSYDNTWTYTLTGAPASINVTFDSQTSVESNYDYIYVMDKNGVNITGSPFTGTSLANATKTVTGDTVKIRLKTDTSVTAYGFKVTNVVAGSGGGTCTPAQLIVNGGFESGATTWTTTSGAITNSTSRTPRTGSYYAWLNGNGTTTTEYAYQTVTVPSCTTTATLSFYLKIDTAETTTSTAYDKLQVQVRNSAGTVLATLATYSNLNKSTTYAQKTFSLAAYKGQTIRIYFNGTEDSSLQTSFLLDDVTLNTN
jgi:vibriolysin